MRQRRSRRGSAGLALGIALATAWAVGCSEPAPPPPEAEPAAPEPAPAFTLDRLGGEPVSLASLRGKTVVIDFWATWCPPCEFQVPELNAFFDAHGAEGDVQVLGVSIDTEGPDVVGAWVTEKQVRYPILLGSEDLAREYGAVGFPTLVIVRPDGTIDSRHVGLIERDELEEALARTRS